MEKQSWWKRAFDKWGVFDSLRSLTGFILQIGVLLFPLLLSAGAVVAGFIKQNFSIATLAQGAFFGLVFGLVVAVSMGIMLPKAVAHLIANKPADLPTQSTTSLSTLPATAPIPAPSLSSEDKESIHQMRVMWNLSGYNAADKMRYLYSTVIDSLDNSVYWIDLLRPSREELNNKILAMNQALELSKQTTLKEVIDAFNEFYRWYVTAAKWLQALKGHGDWKIDNQIQDGAFERFGAANKKFSAALGDLHERPAYKGVLKVSILAPGAWDFLGGREK